MELKKHFWFLLPLVLLGLFAMKTFIGPAYFDGHDSQAHIVRLSQYDLALKDGQFPPKWAGDLLSGHGYPVFFFTYQLPYALAEGFHEMGFSLPVAIKFTFIFSYLVSTLVMYIFANLYFKSRLAGFTSALLWSWAPPIFEQIFVGAALGSITSFIFIPLVFLSLFLTLTKPSCKSSFFLAIALTGWILSHLLTLLIFMPLVLLLLLFHFNKKSIKYLLVSGLLAIGLSSWYLIPALTLNKFTHYQDFVLSQYESQFVSFKRLIYSTWGTDAPGWGNNPVSQQVGIAQWLAVVLAVILLIIPSKSSRRVLEGKKAWPFFLSFALSIFLMLSISKPVWDLPTPLQSISTPWRFLSLSVFSAAILAGFVINNIKTHLTKLFIFVLLITLAIYGNRNHLRINEAVNYDQSFFDNYTGVATGWNEHLPIWVKEVPKNFPENKVQLVSGDCQIADLITKSNLTSFTINCSKDSIIQINTAYFPGWKILVNNQNIIDQVKQNLSTSNGMIRFNLNPGNHQVSSSFK
jgi:hypothetical protein